MVESLKIYLPLAGLALISRLVLGLFPAPAATGAQAAALAWPVFVSVVVLGFPAVHYAHRWGTTTPAEPDATLSPALLRAVGLGALSALFLIALDLGFTLPRDLNVIGASTIPFYLSGAFLVEVVQHLIPLVLWLGLVGHLLLRGRHEGVVYWAGALLIAALEPASQLGGGFFEGYSATFFVVAAILFYGINLLQLWVFRRHGFVTMFAFRVAMYALWHMIWGSLRLQVLF